MTSPQGIIALNKPQGLGSFDVIRRLKKRYQNFPRAGFMGTLDPMATGVLPLFLDAATKIIPFVRKDPKIYRLRIRFGSGTDSYDSTGKVTETCPVPPDTINPEKIVALLPSFTGTITQTPPPLSACRVDGKRAYDHFFAGSPVTPPARDKIIYQIEFNGFFPGELPEIELVVSCQIGTYMRSLAVDIGKAFSLPAHMSSLCRLASGDFLISECVELDELLDQDFLPFIQPVDRFLPYPEVIVTEDSRLYQLIKNGNQVKNLWKVPGGLVKIKDNRMKILAIYQSEGEILKSAKILV
ncbi:MAG: tRNA pseudouridine(55) synthase TruB [Candidatus Wallbacteria bacterium]|nr:tRNA pseudouridine(55) synthase TruB [Candidatus Wallbacteria bacterium]